MIRHRVQGPMPTKEAVGRFDARARVRAPFCPVRLASHIRSAVAVACAAALASAPVSAASAQDRIYQNDGRYVGMGAGGERVFFTYYNIRHQAFRELAVTLTQGILETLKTNSFAGNSLGFSEGQLAIVREIDIRPSTTRSLGMISRYQSGRYTVLIPDEAAYFYALMAQSLWEVNANKDRGYINLFIMSEMDWFRGRSPRWYQAATYSKYHGYPPPPTKEGDFNNYNGVQAYLMTVVLLHEICHHTLGHTRAGAERISTLIKENRQSEASSLSIANEIAADRCAADFSANIGFVPSVGIAANLAVPIVMGNAASPTHPISTDRIRQAKMFDEAAIQTAVRRGMLKPDQAATARTASEEFIAELEDYHRHYY